MPQQQLTRIGSLKQSYDGHQKVKLSSRIVVMGSANVGKTAIIEQFLYEQFPKSHHATVEQIYQAEYEVRGIGILTLDILDTSGSYEFPAMRELEIKSGDAFILVYSVDNAESYEEVSQLRDLILQLRSDNNNNNDTAGGPPIVIVGNKCDLADKRVIRKAMAETVVCLDWENGYVESSAKDDINVIKIFQEMMVQMNVPLDVGKAIANCKKTRRSSLPEYPTNNEKNENKNKMTKRNSCAVS